MVIVGDAMKVKELVPTFRSMEENVHSNLE